MNRTGSLRPIPEIPPAPTAEAEIAYIDDIDDDFPSVDGPSQISQMSTSQCSSILTADSGRASSQSTLKSPEKETGRRHSRKMVVCRISLLDGTTFEPNGIDKNSTGQGVFDKVTQHLDLIETDYFGLTYRDKTNKKFWVDNTKKISKQLKGSSWVFEFQVKFYPPDPQALKEDLTRYQVCLQVRVDIFNGRLPCSFVTYALLGSYTVQAELGDYDPLEYGGRIDYLKDFDFAPVQQSELLEKITELHKHHKGQTPEEAESHFLENAKKLAMYGVDLHDVKDVENKPLVLGIHASGILVYKDRLRINRFVWPKILKLSYKRNIFYVQIRPGPADPHEKTVGFKLDNHKMAKRLWKTCVEHHAFFRLKDVEGMNEGTLFPRFNTKFRYSGRTQAQAKKAAEAQHRPEPHIARTAERRSLNKDKSKDDMELNRNDIDPSRIEDGKQRRAPVNKEEEDRRKAEFFQLLRETPAISRHSRWNDVRPRIDSDPRYEAVGSDPKRQEWFNEYVRDLGLKEDFHKLLDDTPDINRHSKWGDVKHKIEADPRYRAIDSAPKKEQWFNDYLKDLGTKEEFQQLLKETPDIDRYSHLNDVKPAIEHDPRYQAVGSDAKREEWFDDYVKNLGLKEDFVQLLKDTPDIHRNSNWEDAKHKLDSDPRYVAVNSSPKREEWFKEYIKGLDSKDEKRRKKEEERKRKEEEKEKKRLEKEKKKKKGDAEDRTDKMGDPNATHTMNGYPDAAELEQGAEKAGKEGAADGQLETDIDAVLAAKKDEGKDGKHGKKGEKGDSFRGGLFGKFGRKSPKGSKKDKEYDPSKDEFPPPPSPLDEEKKKKAGMTWALPGMEELKERQESGNQLKADFFQLLKETPEVDSRSRLSDVKKKIESDPRYKAVDGDPRREDWFREYTRHLGDLKADYFKLLKDTPGIDRHSKWNDVKHKIESDPRYIAVDSNARREDWFKEFIRNQIRHDFFQLLRDTPDITRHSKWNDVKRKIDHDPRFKAVDSSARREDWFKDYVRDLGLKEDYYQLLKDTPDVNRDSRWRDVRPKIEHDPRYIAVDSNARREDWFRDYVRDLRLDDGMYPGGDKSIDRKMQFMPIVPPTVETKSKGDASRMPFFEPAGESDDSFGKKGPPPIAKKPKAPGGYDSEEDRYLRHSGEPPTVQTESFKYTPNLDEIPITTSNIPIVETKTHTVTYEKDGVPFETEDSILISAHSVTTKSQTIDTTTYKTERDGVIETRVERKITVTSDENDDIDHDRLLREAIEAVTNMNPDVSVERIECIKQIEGEK